ncbi:MAG: hypothetical protein QW456_09265 [Ignisphaera sp.]
MKIWLRLVAVETAGSEEGARLSTEILRFSADHGELLAKSVYTSSCFVVQSLVFLVAENEMEKEMLTRYATFNEVPDPARVVMQVVSIAVADALSTAKRRFAEHGSS